MKQSVTYLGETDINVNDDLLARKEFRIFRKNVEAIKFQNELRQEDYDKNIIPKLSISKNLPDSNYLELKSYQMLTRNYFNPNTPYTRLLMKFMTGLGKTVGSISIALNFINYYKQSRSEENSPLNPIGSVYIIGFTQNIFREELIKYPEFGFISREELADLKLLKKRAYEGSPIDIEKLKKFKSMLKKRLGNRKGNGFFKFIGYKELAGHLFMINDPNNAKYNLLSMTEAELKKNIEEGNVIINKELLAEFANSLIICDEIHNVYNTLEKNHWGVALQTILNYHDSARALFLSATPLNNSPTEVIDLLNLLLPRKYYPSLNKKDYFDKVGEKYILKKSKIPEIANYFKGRISFIRDNNPAHMASKKFMGKEINGIDYLKFVRCPMSKFQYNTYKAVEEKGDPENLGLDGQYLLDYSIPVPGTKDIFGINSIGLYRPRDIKAKYTNATTTWKSQHGITYNPNDNTINGRILQQKTLGKISAKYSKMLSSLFDIIKEKKGKVFIYHNFIHMSGTLFIKEVLQQNNIIGEFDNPTDNTLCICGKAKNQHSSVELNPLFLESKEAHVFRPVRFAIVHSELEKNIINRSLDKFNAVSNVDGSQIMILIGSKIMKESHSINSVRNIFIMSRPDNISTLIQIIGRALRLGSHNSLPKKDREVEISIFVSSIPDHFNHKSSNVKVNNKLLSYEETKYMEKVETFKVIQQLEKLMHENAIDKYFNYSTIWDNESLKAPESIDILHYNLDTKILSDKELNLSTFNVYYAKFEIEYIAYIIKRLFIEVSSAWTYDDLFAAVKKPPFNIEIDSKIISQNLFNIALNNILSNNSEKYADFGMTEMINTLNESNIMDKLHNPDDKIIITIGEINYVIAHVGELYCLVPIQEGEIFIDVEAVYRRVKYNEVKNIDIEHYLKHEAQDSYLDKKGQYINKWKPAPLSILEQALLEYDTKFHATFLEDIIGYFFNLWTNGNNGKKDINHSFYIKMLYFYDLFKLVAWADKVNKELTKRYSGLSTSASDKLLNQAKHELKNIGDKKITNIKNEIPWLPSNLEKEYNIKLMTAEKLFEVNKKTGRVPANFLPIGHYVNKIPRFYNSLSNIDKELNKKSQENWEDYIADVSKEIKENDVIVGFDQCSKTGIAIKFKLRGPMTGKDLKDGRYVEKGMVCSSKSKVELQQIAKKLGLNIDLDVNIDIFCSKIRHRLIYLELQERHKIKGYGLRYFYTIIEI